MAFWLILYCMVIDVFGFPRTAHAYLDPGTGSLLLQAVAGAFLIAGMYFRRVRTFVKNHVLATRFGKRKP